MDTNIWVAIANTVNIIFDNTCTRILVNFNEIT